MDMDWSVVVSTGTFLVVTVSIYIHRNRKSTIDGTLAEIKQQQAENHQELADKQEAIYKEVVQTNGKVIRLEEWAKNHEAADNRRFETLHGDVVALRNLTIRHKEGKG